MNERIQELALQAGKYADVTQPRGSYTRDGMWLYAYNEKFAELIVGECIVDFYRRYLDLNINEDITVQVERYVKEHFGVEE